MENLRWILLGIGIVVILGIYLVARLQTMQFRMPDLSGSLGRLGGRRRSVRKDKGAPLLDEVDEIGMDVEPAGPEDEFDALFLERGERPAPAPKVSVTAKQPQPPREPARVDEVFSLFVTAPHGVPFRGPLLLGALEAARLEHGDMQIFHRIDRVDGMEKTLFSAANIREPGTFDPAQMEDFTTEGIAFFMQVHRGIDAVAAFEAMVESARILAESLGGTVCDATRSVLTKQTISHMRESVINCQLQQRMAKAAS